MSALRTTLDRAIAFHDNITHRSNVRVVASKLITGKRYEIIIFWSDKDRAFLADVPELPGCMAHGASHEEALRNAQEAIQLWIETAEEDGRPVPQPKGRRLVYA